MLTKERQSGHERPLDIGPMIIIIQPKSCNMPLDPMNTWNYPTPPKLQFFAEFRIHGPFFCIPQSLPYSLPQNLVIQNLEIRGASWSATGRQDPMASARADDAGRHEFRDGLLQLGVLADLMGIPWYPFPKN